MHDIHNEPASLTGQNAGKNSSPYRNEPATTKSLPKTDSQRKESRITETVLGKLRNSWTLEIAAAFLGATSVTITVVVLGWYADGPLPSWSFGITLNAFAAATNIIFAGSMGIPLSNGLSQLKWIALSRWANGVPLLTVEHLDAASRGPWGCLMLLASLPRSFVGCMGLLLILSLLTGISTQLIIRYPTMELVLPNDTNTARVATLGVARRLQQYQDMDMIRAFSNGLYSTHDASIINSIPALCSSGNCTWPVITTLAICSQCTNRTTEIKREKASADAHPHPYTLGDLVLRKPGESFNATGIGSSLAFDIFNATILYMSGQTYDWYGPPHGPFALECRLSLCGQEISSHTINGTTSQNITMTWRNDTTMSAIDAKRREPGGFYR